ncbi:MAG: DUF4249 family protein [Flavobacteriales bacterium]|jgi:hypothetical protein|nr:DUF4249 family protein [Flavobacteriales bacterium]
MKKYIYIISLLLISCQEEITLELPQSQDKIVVEGSIENGFPPYVILTKNQGYFESIDENTYNNLFIDADTVKVWYINDAGEKEIKLLEKIMGIDSLPPIYTDKDHLNNLVATPDIPYDFSQEGRTYYLEIKWNNQIISSSTTIPKVTPLDSLWVEKSENEDKEFKYDIRALYSDPADQNNNILLKSKRVQHYEIKREDTSSCEVINYPDFSLKLVDAGSDILINGQSFETFFPKPKDNGNPFSDRSYNADHTEICDNGDTLVFKNDIVLIKYCQIDESSLKFWRGLIRQVGTNGNPFAEPLNLVSNITNGLGIFTGYGSAYYMIPIVKDTVIFEQYTPEIIDIF